MSPVQDEFKKKGFGALAGGRFEDAVDAFSASLAIEPAQADVLSGRGAAYFQLKSWPLAEADFVLAKNLNDDDPEVWGGLALSLAMQNKIYPAIALFEDLLERWPENVRGHIQLGTLHFKLGAIRKGRELLAKALTLRPGPKERKIIENSIKEQDGLDKKRYYRPDFELLRRRKP